MKVKKIVKDFRLHPEVCRLLAAITEKQSPTTQTKEVEEAIREKAERLNIK